MLVQTTTLIDRPVDDVWPVLCDSRIQLTPRCPVFYLGAPRPVECRLPTGSGGVGSTRQCVSEQGTIQQRITEWVPPSRLAFRMEGTELAFARCVSNLSDTFELEPVDGRRATILRRTTNVEVSGRLRWAKGVAVYVGLKAVHRFVFRDWR